MSIQNMPPKPKSCRFRETPKGQKPSFTFQETPQGDDSFGLHFGGNLNESDTLLASTNKKSSGRMIFRVTTLDHVGQIEDEFVPHFFTQRASVKDLRYNSKDFDGLQIFGVFKIWFYF
jgi:hypothetical protein